MRFVTLVGDQEEGLVVAVVHLGNPYRAVEHEAGLAQLVVVAGLVEMALFRSVCVDIRVLKDIVSRAVELVGPRLKDGVRDGAAAMSHLSIEDRLRDLDFLHRFRRRRKSGVSNAGETLGRIVRNAVQGDSIVAAASIGDSLDRYTAEGVGELARLALEVTARSAVNDADGESYQDVRVAAIVRQIQIGSEACWG